MTVLDSHIARKRPARLAATTIAIGTASMLALSACASSGKSGTSGTGNSSPAQTLASSFSKFGSGTSASFELTLKPDAAMIAAMTKGAAAKGAAFTQKLLNNGGIDVKVSVSGTKPLKDLTSTDPPSTDFTVSAGGKQYLDLRVVGGALFLKVNVADALTASGTPAGALSALAAKVPPTFLPAVQALESGNWVTISAADLKSVETLMSTLGSGATAPAAGATVNPTQAAQAASALVAALLKDATVTDKGNGQLAVSGSEQAIAQDILQAVEPLLGSVPTLPKDSLAKAKASAAKLPTTPVTFDAWIKNQSLSEIQIDLAQFLSADKAGGGHLPLDLKLSNSAATLSAPSGATPIDIKSLLGAGL